MEDDAKLCFYSILPDEPGVLRSSEELDALFGDGLFGLAATPPPVSPKADDLPSLLSEAAPLYLTAGISIVPTGIDKKPTRAWKELQSRRATLPEIAEWVQVPYAVGVAVIGGEVSGNLEIIDFDFEGEWYERWREIVSAKDPSILGKLVVERSKSGGFHVAYRCTAAVDGNTKVASKRVPVPTSGKHPYGQGKEIVARQEDDSWFIYPCLVETRGEGGYCIIAPSPGYAPIHLDFRQLPTLTVEERALLLDAARSLDETPKKQEKPALPKVPASFKPEHVLGVLDKKRPGDDFNARGDITPYLHKHGWSPAGGQYWTRPGKGSGVSASLLGGQVLYVFSSNAEPFQPNRGYSPFSVLTMLEHGGNASSAAKALAAEGYGDQSPFKYEVPASSPSPLIEVIEKDDAPDRPQYNPPPMSEVLRAVAGSPLAVYVEEVRKISPIITDEIILADAILLAGLELTNQRVRVSQGYETPIWPNVYVMKVASSGSGKGRCSRLLALQLAPALHIPRLSGESQAAIIGRAKEKGAAFGLFYEPEVKNLMDPTSATARQKINLFTAAWDYGTASYHTRPSGEAKEVDITPFYPSLLIDAQPQTIENSMGKSVIDVGFNARCLMPTSPVSDGRMKTMGSPDGARIIAAYKDLYERAPHDGTIMRDFYIPPSRCDEYEAHMTPEERSCAARLMGEYVVKVALMLGLDKYESGEIPHEAMDRAAVVCDFFFSRSQQFLALMVSDKDELMRVKAVRYISAHPGCNLRSILNHIKCSVPMWNRECGNTLVMRGMAHEVDGKWFVGAKK